MNAEARNFAKIVHARDHHDGGGCPYGRPAIEVHMSPFDIGRMGWDEGDTIAGLRLVASQHIAPDRLRIVCDADPTFNNPERLVASLPQPRTIVVPDRLPEAVPA